MPVHQTTPQDASYPLFAGVDVGGTGIKLGLVDDLGRSVAQHRMDTLEERGPEDAVRRIRLAIDEMLAAVRVPFSQVAAIGLGTPGTMDVPRGMILTPPNLPNWRHYPIRDELSKACEGRLVAFVNDANAAAFGEFWVGSGQAAGSMIMLTLGTGVGGGIIVDGRLIDGVNSFGSECGHIIVDSRDDARYCVWGGGQGELEAYASASAVIERARQLLAAGRESSLRARVEHDELTGLMLYEEATRGDRLSLEVIEEAGRYLGIGIVTLVHAIDPGMVVLGGAMNFGGESTSVGRLFLETVRHEFRRRAFDVVVNTTTIAYASLGADAGYVGCAGVARQAWQNRGGATLA